MKRFKKIGVIAFLVLMFSSECIYIFDIKLSLFNTKNVSYSESVGQEVYSDDFLGIVYPCEIKSFEETSDGFIAIHTNPKSFIVAPLKMECDIVEAYGMKGLHFERFGFDCYFYGFDYFAIKSGAKCRSGDILGSIVGDILYVRVYRNENRVSLKSLSRLLGG